MTLSEDGEILSPISSQQGIAGRNLAFLYVRWIVQTFGSCITFICIDITYFVNLTRLLMRPRVYIWTRHEQLYSYSIALRLHF